MRKSKFSETQIVGILKDAESGVPVPDLLRKYGVSKATFFKWRGKYGGASVSDVKRLRELEAENAKLKRMYADEGGPMSKILAVTTHASDDPTKATLAFITAVGAIGADKECTIALVGEAALLAREAVAKNYCGAPCAAQPDGRPKISP
jgi:putative transposase